MVAERTISRVDMPTEYQFQHKVRGYGGRLVPARMAVIEDGAGDFDQHYFKGHGPLVGYCDYYIESHGEQKILHVGYMLVRPSHRERGIANAMIDSLVAAVEPDVIEWGSLCHVASERIVRRYQRDNPAIRSYARW